MAYKLRDKLNNKEKLKIYYSYVYNQINYGIEIYANSIIGNIQKIQVMQDRFFRVMFYKKSKEDIKKLYGEQHILNCKQIFVYKIIMIAYNKIHKMGKNAIDDMMIVRENEIGRKSKCKNNLVIPYCKTKYEQKSMQYQTAFLWNQVNSRLKELKLEQFKIMIKKEIENNNIKFEAVK